MARARLEVCLLGPLELRLDGVAQPLTGTRQRALLALLALRANEPVSSGRLADELWGERPPPAAQASLRMGIAKLRALLGEEHRGLLATVPGGYRLSLERAQLDSARFEALLSEPARLEEALALWRGPALADLEGYPFAAAEAARLAEIRVAAREERATLALEGGRPETVVAELRSLVAESPYRERSVALLMLALYRSGRQAEALDVYRETRRRLRDDLGLEPGEELRQLERSILAHDPSLDPPPRPGRIARPRRRPLLTAAAGAVVLAAAAAAAAVLVSRPGGDSAVAAVVPAHSLALLAPRGGVDRMRLDWTPSRVALSRHTLWMLDAPDRTVSRFDLDARRVVRTIGLGVTPTALTVGAGAAWVLAAPERTLVRVDPAYDFIRTTRLPLAQPGDLAIGNPAGLTVTRGGVWIEDGVSVFRVDPETAVVTARLTLGPGLDGIAVGAGSIWVTRGSPATLIRIDARTARVAARIPIATARGPTAPYPIGVAFGGGAAWVLNGNTGTVSRVDAALDRVTATLPRVSLDPTRIAAGAGAVWIADVENDAVERIDPAGAKVTRTLDVGGLPASLAAGPGGVWVAVDAS
jgi:DNA-binding SARP family transcriptional activator/DNA-binding beta-propeller fold protein YncE